MMKPFETESVRGTEAGEVSKLELTGETVYLRYDTRFGWPYFDYARHSPEPPAHIGWAIFRGLAARQRRERRRN